jgi:Xaa-Pro aminopeptidase
MNRIARLRAVMAAQGIDATVLVPGSNLQYLAGIGFTTKLRLSCLVVPLTGTPVLVVPTMEGARAQAVATVDLEVIGWDDGPGPQAAVTQALARHALHQGHPTIAVEHVVMRVFELRAVEVAAPQARIVNADPVIAQLRMRKDASELAAMRKAVTVAETTLAQAIAAIRPGMSEVAVAALWEDAIRAAGSEPSFGIAVGSGPNGASPHHSNGARTLQAGDLVVIDGGAIVDGYVSDITRTIAIGAVSERARLVYQTVLAANVAGRAAAALPGASGDSVDRAARQVIDAAGFGPYFIHRTGHGLGVDIHEPPFMVGGDMNTLDAGMTFTVEPGIYLPNEFGVRIEDMVVRTADGAETLTCFDRELYVVKES